MGKLLKPSRLTIRLFFEDSPPIQLTVGLPLELATMLQNRKLTTAQFALEAKASIGGISLEDWKIEPHGG